MSRTWLHNEKQSNWWQTIKQARALWVEVDGDQRAAAFAYYLLLSLLPLVFILVTAGSLFVEHEVASHEVVQWIERYVPLTGEQERGAMANIHGVLYGALGGVMAFLMWIYLSSCVGVFGVCFCAAQADVRVNGNSNLDRSLAASSGGDS